MELQLSDEQTAFVETVRRFLAAECPVGAVRALEQHPDGFDRDVWRRSAELGWTSLLVSEADGGGCLSEHGLADLALVAEEMGRFVAPGPLVPVNVVAGAISRHGTQALKDAVLPRLLDGTSVAAWCGPDPVTARSADGAVVATGECRIVEAAGQAEHLLVTLLLDDEPAQAVVPADAPGVTITPLAGLDLVRRFASVRLDDVRVDGHAVLQGDSAEAIDRQWCQAVTLQCAESVGAMDHVFAMTLEYLGDRYSFGRPLSSYQALKHRMADQKTWLEAGHGIATAAVRAVAAERDDAAELASAAAWWIGPHATELMQDCIQLHGGIGVTWEHDLHLYLRRVTVNRATHGTPEQHAERIATQLLGAAS